MARKKKRGLVKRISQSTMSGERHRELSLLYAQGKAPKSTGGKPITAMTLKEIKARERRAELIHNATASEIRFRAILKGFNIQHKFQEVVHVSKDHYYIMDFVVEKRKPRLIFEIDGSVHATQVEYDDMRTERILRHRKYVGFRVIRFSNDQVFSGEAYRAIGNLYGAKT